jgi:hypothetical protein
MVLLHGVNVSDIGPIGTASECCVMKYEGGPAADRFVMNTCTLIVDEWHVLFPSDVS